MKNTIMRVLLLTLLAGCSSQKYQTKCLLGKWDACYKLKAKCDGGNAEACGYYEKVKAKVDARESLALTDPVAAEQIRLQEETVENEKKANRIRAYQATQPVKVKVKANCTTTRSGNTAQTNCY